LVVPQPLAGPNGADKPPTFHHFTEWVGNNNSLSRIHETHAKWKQFIREDAFKVLIVITDDDPHYGGSDMVAQFDADMLAKPGFGSSTSRRYSFNAVVGWKEGTPVTSTTKCSGSETAGMNYRRLTTLTGGLLDSVCKSDFSGVFDAISRGVTEQVACDVALPTAPGADASRVRVVAGTDELVPVTDATKCGANPDGWFFDSPEKNHVRLCEQACSKARTAAKLNVSLACATQTPR